MQITSFEDLKRYKEGNVVELPPFGDGQPFVARMKRPSLMEMVGDGTIGNPLLHVANELFFGESKQKRGDSFMKDSYEVFKLVARESFIEPTYAQIEESGVKLTDEQLMFVFNYSQHGIEALEFFRTDKQN